MVELSDKAHSELLAVFQMTTDDLERAKQWAWTLVYYTVIAQGGILALSTAYAHPRPDWALAVFAGFLFGTTVASHVLLGHTSESLKVFRDRIERCRSSLQPATIKILGAKHSDHTWPFRLIIWVTFGVFVVLLRL